MGLIVTPGRKPPMTNRTALAVTAAALSLAAIAMPAPASAAAPTGWNNCPAGTFCLWAGPNSTGVMAYYRIGSINVSGQGLAKGGRSAWNRTGSSWCTWVTPWVRDPLPQTGDRNIGAGAKVANLDPPAMAVHRPDWTHCV
ncbi:peptidase inhibitor family I36 protein [Nonomuraea thailandensis]|nr:peptidase inhibitor family I36 protein [Nonomuraea thailandensis]